MGNRNEAGIEYPTPKEMQGWLEREITDVTRAAELRIRDATRFVTAFARSELSAEEAAAKCFEYTCRWGEPLPGIARSTGMTDDEIVRKIDQTRTYQGTSSEITRKQISKSRSSPER